MLKLLTVLGLGAIELWAAIPAGFALKLHPVVISITATIGALLGALLTALLGERVRVWLIKHPKGTDEKKHPGRVYRIWLRYGVAGLGLSAPLLTGAPAAVALGLVLGAPRGRLLFWVSLGIVLWSPLLTVAGVLGFAGIEALSRR